MVQSRIGSRLIAVALGVHPEGEAIDRCECSSLPYARSSRAATEAKVAGTVAAHQTVIRHYDPQAIDEGVPTGQELWFLLDADGNVVRAGRRTLIIDPEASRAALQQTYPGIKISYVTRGTGVKDSHGKRIPVSWQWLERESPTP